MSKKRKRKHQRQINRTRAVVDIVMPVYGQLDFLELCLKSLFSYDAGVPYTVTMVDDAGPEPIEGGLLGYGTKIVKHPRNKGFAAACNTGARSGKAPWILLLNTDTLITHDGWLKHMVDEGNDPKVGVVGCLLEFFPESQPLYSESLLRPAGKAQHAGVAFDILGRPYHIFSGWSVNHPKVQQRREMNCVTGACFLTRRSLWRRLGGLDEDYTKGNFEDVQYCIQARLSGYKVIYTPKARLFHYAGGSGNSTTANKNAQLFQLKMGQFVEYDEWRHW